MKRFILTKKEAETSRMRFLIRVLTIIFTLLFLFAVNTPLPVFAQEQPQEQITNQTQEEPQEQITDQTQEEPHEQEKDKKIDSIEDLEHMTLEELLNIKVTTAGKKEERIGEIPASVVVIYREDIEKYGYQTLGEILESIPGLYYTDDYLTKNFGVRGFWTVDSLRNMIVLVNDVQQTEFLLNSNFMELFAIPAEAIDRIEVVRGPMSVIYGTGAFFGAINIFTNKVYGGAPVSFVSASTGSEKSNKIVVRASGKGDDYQYAFNGSFFDTYGLDKPLNKMGPYQGDTGGKLENNEKYFNFSGTFKEFSFDSSYSQSNKEVAGLVPSVSDGTMMIWKALRLNFGYQKEFSDKLKVNAKFGYFLNQWNYDFDWLFPGFYGRQINGSSGYRGELNLFWNPISKLNVTVGLNYTNVPEIIHEYTIPIFNLNLIHHHLAKGESIVSQSIFAQFDYVLARKLKIVAGARLDQAPAYTLEKRVGDFNTGVYTSQKATYSNTKAEFIPRLALIYSIDRRNYIKFLYGKAINRPSFFQNLDLLLPAEQLKPETIQTLELNYVGNLSSEFSLSLSVFRNTLDKLIYRTFIKVGDVLYTRQANVGKMTTNGVELTAQYSPLREFKLELSGTYQNTKEKREGFIDKIEPGYSPHFLGYVKASYFFNYDLSIAVTGNYVDKMLAYFDNDPRIDDRIGESVKGYFLLGANLRANQLFGTGLFLNIRGSNILDSEVRYPATSNNSGFAPLGTIGRGISFLLTLGWKF